MTRRAAPLAVVERLSFAYPGSAAVLRDVSLELVAGEIVVLLGPSGAGKSTLLRALAGLVPHFHGGRFEGSVRVAGHDTRATRPAELAGTVASVFQDPEDQVVMTRVENEVAFGLECLGTPPALIRKRADVVLAALGAEHLNGRRTPELSGGELQRVCLASALALEPELLLLDEPTSQLDADGADAFLDAVARAGCAVMLSEQRIARALAVADRVLYLEEGRIALDAPPAEAACWLRAERPRYAEQVGEAMRRAEKSPEENGRVEPSAIIANDRVVVHSDNSLREAPDGAPRGDGAAGDGVAGRGTASLAALRDVSFAYPGGPPALDGISLEVRPGEIVALEGPNGSGKTTLAKLAAGLLEPTVGQAVRRGRSAYLSQDPGRYLVRETVREEVALGARGDLRRAQAELERFGLAAAADRHPRDLSSGERERLGLAAVAACDADLVVLDEPTRGVDPDRKADLRAWILQQAASGRGVLLATHDPTLPAHRRVRLGTGARDAAEVAVRA